MLMNLYIFFKFWCDGSWVNLEGTSKFPQAVEAEKLDQGHF